MVPGAIIKSFDPFNYQRASFQQKISLMMDDFTTTVWFC